MTIRSDLRDLVGLALEQSDWGFEMTRVKSWSQALDSTTLPVFGVSTRTQTTTEYTKELYLREIEVVVCWKRVGNLEIEDAIDDDAEVIEGLVLAALAPSVFNVVPRDLQIENNAADGGQRIGIGISTFACEVHTEIPAV